MRYEKYPQNKQAAKYHANEFIPITGFTGNNNSSNHDSKKA
jgi:hypothetical protein